jgi:hypothetical protein
MCIRLYKRVHKIRKHIERSSPSKHVILNIIICGYIILHIIINILIYNVQYNVIYKYIVVYKFKVFYQIKDR